MNISIFVHLLVSKYPPSLSSYKPFCPGLQNHYTVAGSESPHPTEEKGTLSRAKKPLERSNSRGGQIRGRKTLPIHGTKRFPAPCFPKYTNPLSFQGKLLYFPSLQLSVSQTLLGNLHFTFVCKIWLIITIFSHKSNCVHVAVTPTTIKGMATTAPDLNIIIDFALFT